MVLLQSDVCAPWTRLELEGSEARFADNFVHLSPGLPCRVAVADAAGLDAPTLTNCLRVTPIIQAWQ